jgi:hypothetical protein
MVLNTVQSILFTVSIFIIEKNLLESDLVFKYLMIGCLLTYNICLGLALNSVVFGIIGGNFF